ncbi:MAG TPA: cellulase family glycosylhydrolase [Acetobacteraceae bacterium]|nr:cellulase family glycosylhydrolase [Acetobacteraceae bacterium]
MTIRCIRIATILLAAIILAGAARPSRARPPDDRLYLLRRGINLTNWFRFPPHADAEALRSYLSDAAIENLHRAGFGFVRISVQPEFLDAAPGRRDLLVEQIARVQRHHLAVVVALHPQNWKLESNPADRADLFRFWRNLAPALRRLDSRLTFPELLNEPVFPHDPEGWAKLQEEVRAVIRLALPDSTIVLTGNDWGSLAGLTALPDSVDPNVVYSFHFYDPVELTSLAAWRPGLDTAVLARLPFPAANSESCNAVAGSTDSATAEVVRYYCAQKWTATSITARIDTAAAWARRNDAVVLLGEFGATARLNQLARLAWFEAVRRACESDGIGWAMWGYDDVMGFDMSRPPKPRETMNTAVLGALGLVVQ